MPLLLQPKLLRVLADGRVRRLGGNHEFEFDVRVIVATNRNPLQAVREGKLREDLFYRLNVFGIHLPPLRDRRDDILPLAESFLEEIGRSMARPATGISRDARDHLLRYAWPGNVRELRNAIERAILLCDSAWIEPSHLPPSITRREPFALLPAAAPPTSVHLHDVERDLIERAIRKANGNKAKAARELGLSRAQLYTRIEKYGLDPRLGRD
jgi:transcriptional regulator with PAS, ATPase and Fis domain